ncbi:MAG: helix-turn-helix domain-containing protein [Oscillatoriophycideae cyanobacterium NC_groundwater_1537_Pr4_S-0.65um_50_18]|nr:helix-turn-helix domain-containing protein [Oscillatoriophycideae cyanobacterium NC_groundwater_1537_Pr4_S-0.65um_50_18]
MAYTLTSFCTQCNDCFPMCPTGAIKQDGEKLWIDPTLCNNCEGFYEQPLCASICLNNVPVPLQAKKGRCKVDAKVTTNPRLFSNGKTHTFASAIVIWEACNVLAQQQSLPWQTDESGNFCHRRQVSGGRGKVTLYVTDTCTSDLPVALSEEAAQLAIASWDIRSACLHLMYAAYATSLDRPWEQSFTVSDQEISDYLGLGKRKDLSKLAKLTLIKDLVEQPCKLLVAADWCPKGRFSQITLPQSHLWHLIKTQHHFQEDDLGCKHLTGLTFTVRAGQWAQFFLNRRGAKERTMFYQYGTLPKSLLTNVMSLWQQHEGVARIMLWLLFKTRMGAEQRITVLKLMQIAYGEKRVLKAASHREERRRLMRSFESDLEVLNRYQLQPVFDPLTYPVEIQPLWVKLADLPDDAEAALEFWTSDGSSDHRLTDAAPRNKWQRLMNARLLRFELPDDWMQQPVKLAKKPSKVHKQHQPKSSLSGQQVAAARKSLQLSQRVLADRLGKSQSWIRDIENGRLQLNERDQAVLSELLS